MTAVLARVDELDVDELLCLGDFVGYHANPDEVVELVRSRPVRAIAGNHDRTAVGSTVPGYFSADARRAIEWTRSAVSGRTKEFLAGLPTSLSLDGSILLTHGAVHPSPNEDVRLNSEQAVAASFEVLRRDHPLVRVCFFGHVHHPRVHELSQGVVCRRAPDCVVLRPGSVYLINPGSVGQPRDGDARSSFCVFDTTHATVQFHRVAYDVATCRSKARQAGLQRSASVSARTLRFGRRWLRALRGR